MTNLIECTDGLNQLAKALQGKTETVNPLYTFLAQRIIKRIDIKNDFDLLLFCISESYMNSAAKSKENFISYGFKGTLLKAVSYIYDSKDSTSKIFLSASESYNGQKMSCLYIEVGSAQFTFHSVPFENNPLNDYWDWCVSQSPIEYCGFKKQFCISSLFEYVISRMECNPNKETVKMIRDLIDELKSSVRAFENTLV